MRLTDSELLWVEPQLLTCYSGDFSELLEKAGLGGKNSAAAWKKAVCGCSEAHLQWE